MIRVEQGLAIVERASDPALLLVMLPDGEIHMCARAASVARIVKEWARRDLKRQRADVGTLRLEWRDGTGPGAIETRGK